MKKLVLFILFLSFKSSFAVELVFIVNPKNPVTEISRQELKEIFLKKHVFWDAGAKIKPVIFTSGAPVQKIFLEDHLQMNERSFTSYWLEQKLSTGNLPPMQVKSLRKMIMFIGIFEESIGFIDKNKLRPRDKNKIKILKILEN